jgi:exopolysaccharide production protein ExoQ
VLSLGATFGIIFAISLVAILPRQFRLLALIYLIIMIAGGTAALYAFGLQDEVLRAFGKDSTLTGRTLLWDIGIKQGMQAPFLGHGYGAFWVQGFAPADALWYRFGIGLRTGFHFHDLYIEAFVELGFIGLTIYFLVLWGGMAKSTLVVLRHGMKPEYVLALGISVLFVLRSFVEVDLLGTYGAGPFILFPVRSLLKQKKPKKSEPGSVENPAERVHGHRRHPAPRRRVLHLAVPRPEPAIRTRPLESGERRPRSARE